MSTLQPAHSRARVDLALLTWIRLHPVAAMVQEKQERKP